MKTADKIKGQKTWKDLLGPDTTGCIVDGRYISRHVGNGSFAVLWTFDTEGQAYNAMRQWIVDTSE